MNSITFFLSVLTILNSAFAVIDDSKDCADLANCNHPTSFPTSNIGPETKVPVIDCPTYFPTSSTGSQTNAPTNLLIPTFYPTSPISSVSRAPTNIPSSIAPMLTAFPTLNPTNGSKLTDFPTTSPTMGIPLTDFPTNVSFLFCCYLLNSY